MIVGITTIQRDRAPWIIEWLAFHMLVGFNRFYIYSHMNRDGMNDILLALSRHYPIMVSAIESVDRPQLMAYQHSVETYCPTVDWMAFIDGDEFLFPLKQETIGDALKDYQSLSLSALAVYWLCYGSNGHMDEPGGLILEHYPRHSGPDFLPNRHIKSILRGREAVRSVTAHMFGTDRGTFDELMRPIEHGWMKKTIPSYQKFRINHYPTQSYEYFLKTKQKIGAADADATMVRPTEWFYMYDRNECDDGISYNFITRLKVKVREMKQAIGLLPK